MAVGAAVAIAGTAYSIYSSNQQAEAEGQAEAQLQSQLREQASELDRRESINRAITIREGEQFIARQSVGFSSNGVDVSSTGALDYLAEQHTNLGRQVELMRQETQYNVNQLNAGIQASGQRAGASRANAGTRNAGSILNLGAGLAGTYGGSRSPSAASSTSHGLSVGQGTSSAGSSYSSGGNYA